MALIVEDGTNVTDADALVDLAFVTAYHAGNDAWGTDTVLQEAAIKRATARVSVSYAWSGERTNGRSQSLVWPRTDVTDCEGNSIGSNEIPTEVKKAVAELSLTELISPSYQTAATVSAATSGEIKRKREELEGLIEETEYFQGTAATTTASDANTLPDIVTSLLRCFATPISTDASSLLYGGTYRV